MDKIKKPKNSLMKYLFPCFAVCGVGIIIIKALLSYFQKWYIFMFTETDVIENTSAVSISNDNALLYNILFFSEYLIIPLWAVLCLWITVKLFYRREIEEPVDVLTKASEQILGDNLDFKVEYNADNELGMLCVSFEEMRKNLYESNYQLWKSLEEKKRLNSAFSHDLRTPITVLKGYTDFINQFNGSLSNEKQAEIMSKMTGQIERLEHYTEKMSSLHKIEDIIPEPESFSFVKLCEQIKDNGIILCGNTVFEFSFANREEDLIYIDTEIVLQVFMNLISNALRFADSIIECTVKVSDGILNITVADDGCGFSDEALRKAWKPFYHEGDANDKEHFGLGLYICRLLCRKTGGNIKLENNKNGGGKVTAAFSVKKSENQIKN